MHTKRNGLVGRVQVQYPMPFCTMAPNGREFDYESETGDEAALASVTHQRGGLKRRAGAQLRPSTQVQGNNCEFHSDQAGNKILRSQFKASNTGVHSGAQKGRTLARRPALI